MEDQWKEKLRFSSSVSSVICIMVSMCLVVVVVLVMSEKMSFPSLLTIKSARVSGDRGAANLINESETSQTSAPPTKERGVDVQKAKPPAGVVGGGDSGGDSDGGTNEQVVSASPPPLHIQDTEFIIRVGETTNTSAIGNNTTSPLNENQVHPNTSGVIITTFSKLEMLEGRMQQARTAIRDANYGNESLDPHYVPKGPTYWNAKSFHRSYMEMEKQFKIFVYEEGEQPIYHNGPCRSIYAMEGNFIYLMENSGFRTRDPNKAHVFFLPISVTSIVHFIFQKNIKHHWRPMKNTVKDYVDLVAGKYSFWNRSLGADHFMLACHDWGPELSKSVPNLYKNSIRALCNANTSEGFNPTKDVSIPEINLPRGTIDGLIGGPSPSKRPILVFFAGGLHGPIRPLLFEHWENKVDDKDVQIHRYLPKGVSYLGMMKQSKFCICPSGYEVASPRMVEAIYSGCVPVLIKDYYVAPFSEVLNWKSFSVIIPVEDIPNLKKILSGISSRQYIRMQQRGKQIRKHFELNFPPKKYDVFHMILHSLWLRRLNVRVHGIEES